MLSTPLATLTDNTVS